jgi:hypothetical protein
MFETHEAVEPAWIRTFVDDVVVAAVTPLGFIGRLGYRYWPPGEHGPEWVLSVFPTAAEVVGTHSADGAKYLSGFEVDVARIVGGMNGVQVVAWTMPVKYNGELDGPELCVRGQFAGKHVRLRFFHLPPSDEPVSFCFNPATRETWEKPVG